MGTEEHIALNDYAQRIQGKQVLIEDGKNYMVEKSASVSGRTQQKGGGEQNSGGRG
jgi:hypothetical protein